MKRILSSVMSKETGIMVIIGICLLVLFIGILKQRADLVLNFVVRMAAGAVAIVFCNQLLSKNGVDIMVGLNPWSLTTVGLLGAGGFTLLYGIMAYRLMTKEKTFPIRHVQGHGYIV